MPGVVIPQDPVDLLGELIGDLRSAQQKLETLRDTLVMMKLPEPTLHRCTRCYTNFPARLDLLDHLHLVHDDRGAGVEREQEWARLEALAAPTV